VARIRSIKPDFCSSKDTGSLNREARLFFLQLLTEADDEGRMLWIPRKLCGVLYPHDDDVEAPLLAAWAEQCAQRRMVSIYEVDGVQYLQITNWTKHQKISHPTKSKLPSLDCPGAVVTSGNAPDLFRAAPESSGNSPEPLRPDLGMGTGNGSGKGNREPTASSTGKPSTPSPPTDLNERKAQRLAQVTDEAVAAFNEILGKPKGLLPAVHPTVGRKNRQRDVTRCLPVAADICQEQFGNKHISPEFWRAYFTSCAADPFKSGQQKPGREHGNWTPTFEYLTRPKTMLEVFDKAVSEDVA
jgi:hypothetical protein